jgi:hypothetical protein
MDSLYCDSCGEQITGGIVVARTLWNTNREGEPRHWEPEYGTVVSPETVKAGDILSKP